MTLTTAEQEQVNAAGEHFSRNHNFAKDRELIEDGFEEGVEWALSTLFEPRCVAFAEWAGKNYTYRIDCLNPNALPENRKYDCYWYDGPHNKKYTTSELYSIYNEQLNKQQDAGK